MILQSLETIYYLLHRNKGVVGASLLTTKVSKVKVSKQGKMGCLSCFNVEDPGENSGTFHAFFQFISSKYEGICKKKSTPEMLPASNDSPALSSEAASTDTQLETATTPPRTLPFDAHSTAAQNSEKSDELAPGHENVTEELENDARESDERLVTSHDRISEVEKSLVDDENNPAGSSNKPPKENIETGFCPIYASLDDEDVCPTCLEEYTLENPRIIPQCKHHYHLGCIYEWMERSTTCPVCSKVMIFEETS